jgi:threonine dehydrogenase-like Zn-dependent dehydrogenase
VPFNISCGTCWMCSQGLQSQCETTQNREQGFGASLFGYTKLYGQVPGGQAEYLRVPFGNTLPIKVPDGPSDDRFVYLSDVLPTSWQAVQYAATPPGGTLLCWAWARSVTCAPASPRTSACGWSGSTSSPSASPGRPPAAPR